MASRPYEKEEDFVIGLEFEMIFDLKTVRRDTYNFLDLISDVGGIGSIFVTFFYLILGIWNYNHLDNYLISKLYHYKSQNNDYDSGAKD